VVAVNAGVTGFAKVMAEINYSSNGLESLFNLVRYKSKVDGIGIEVWDPAKDMMLVKRSFEKNAQRHRQLLVFTSFSQVWDGHGHGTYLTRS
jgi:hypothetical protein